MREHSYNFNIEHSTVEYMCIGGHAAQRWIAWVRDGLEHCLWWNCAMERDDKEIEGEITAQVVSAKRWLLILLV